MRTKIVDIAREYLNVRFRHQGRNKAGIDCVGLLVCVAQELGAPHHDQHGYKRRPNGMDFVVKFRASGFKEKGILNRKHGDVLVIEEYGNPCHVAILANDQPFGETIVHSFAARRRVVEEPYTDFWKKKTVMCFEFPEVDE